MDLKKLLLEISPVINGVRYDLPFPTLSPDERRRRRLAFRNERHLYQRKCDFTGKNIISNISPDKPFKVYSHEVFWSDQWDAADYGRDFDFNRTFFEQFKDLYHSVPMIQMIVVQCENCDYTNHSWRNKNSYLIFDAGGCESCYYSHTIYSCLNCFDCFQVKNCELCYECVDCEKCYACKYALLCQNSSNLSFCFDCRGCSDCFMCTNLRNKQYYIYNKPYSKEDYEKILSGYNLGSYKTFQEMLLRFLDFKKKEGVHHFNHNVNCEMSEGLFLKNCKECDNCFNCGGTENGAFLYDSPDLNGKKVMDDDRSGWGAELCYETMGCPTPYGSIAVMACGDPKFTHYSIFCQNPVDCFGCVGMKKSNYCILNRQYTKEEYEKLVPRIISHMQETGEWGEFFPAEISPFCYNETLAFDFFPLSEKEVLDRGLAWKKVDHKEYQKVEKSLPDLIDEVEDNITETVFACAITGKNFRLTPQELDFYKKQRIPLPRFCPDQRQDQRISSRPSYSLNKIDCTKCGIELNSCYSRGAGLKVYCEKCYLEFVH